jgi:cephalosporin-C deacetylase
MTTARIQIRRFAEQRPVLDTVTTGSPVRIRLAPTDSRKWQAFEYEVTGPNGLRLALWSGVGGLTDQRLTSYKGNLLADPDALFQSYWKRAREEVDRVDPSAKLVRVPDRDTSGGLFFRVELSSTQGARIVGWYIVPRKSRGQVPAILILPGYGAEEPPSDRTADGFATLALSPRGHGPSKELGWKPDGELMFHGITRAEEYFYRLAVQDAVQGVRFLASQEGIGPIGVEGGSQGGLLALGAAALCPREVRAVVSNVPCFSDYGSSMQTALAGPHRSLRISRAQAAPSDLMLMNASMGLTDGVALATLVRQPLQVVMGSMDVTSPVASGYAIFNRSPARRKSLVLLADEGHALPKSMQERNRQWFRKHLTSGAASR